VTSVLYCKYGNSRQNRLVKMAQKLTPTLGEQGGDRLIDERKESRLQCRDNQWLPLFHHGISLSTLDLVSEAEEAKRSTIICTALCKQRVSEELTNPSPH
jgi:hypothetical protein